MSAAGRKSRAASPSDTAHAAGSDYPRRRSHQEVEAPADGWRASKRSSKLGKRVRRNARAERIKQQIDDGAKSTRSTMLGVLEITGIGLGAAVVLALVLLVMALGVNAGTRWYLKREADNAATPEAQARRAKENLLIIGSDGKSAEFLAVRLDETGGQISGIAIPSGAFMEVPGQGYERVGDSLSAGPGVSLAAVSNYLTVPFEHYVIVDLAVYQDALTNQSLRDVMGNVKETDLEIKEQDRIATFIKKVSGDRTALVPLPVKPIDLGGTTYFEPQRDEIADLLLQWWDVKLGAEDSTVRVIIYNGIGTPGIAGVAAQQLIAAGMRVVDTKNADRFDYAKTLVVVQSGDLLQGDAVAKALGTGEVVDQPSEQDVADVIVIIGKDYKAPDNGGR